MTIEAQDVRKLDETFNVGSSDGIILFRDNKVVRTSAGELGRFINGDIPSFDIDSSITISAAGNYWVDTTVGDITVTLPPLTGVKGSFYIKKIAGGNDLIIDGNGALIDGELSQTITTLWNGITCIPKLTVWYIGK